MEAVRQPAEAFAATWRNAANEIVATTSSSTMCELRRNTWWLRISNEDFTAIVPCGECAGCLEFYRRRLADRFVAKYGAARDAGMSTHRPRGSVADASTSRSREVLYLIRIYAPAERHAWISHQLHRRRGLELEPGFFRLGATSFGVLSRDKRRVHARDGSRVLESRAEPIYLKRGRRAWRAVTAGMLRTREEWGVQVKRWYMPGLPPADKLSWKVDTQGGAKDYIRTSSPRAWKGDKLVLVPPEFWKLSRHERREIRSEFGRSFSAEGYARVMAIVASALDRKSQSSSQSAAGRPLLTRAQVIESYRRRAMKQSDASESERPSRSSSPPSEGGGYLSSVHTGDAGPPEIRADDGLYHGIEPLVTSYLPAIEDDKLTDLNHEQLLKRRERRELEAMFVRMAAKAKERGQ